MTTFEPRTARERYFYQFGRADALAAVTELITDGINGDDTGHPDLTVLNTHTEDLAGRWFVEAVAARDAVHAEETSVGTPAEQLDGIEKVLTDTDRQTRNATSARISSLQPHSADFDKDAWAAEHPPVEPSAVAQARALYNAGYRLTAAGEPAHIAPSVKNGHQFPCDLYYTWTYGAAVCSCEAAA